MSSHRQSVESREGGEVMVRLPQDLAAELGGMYPGEDIVGAIALLKAQREADTQVSPITDGADPEDESEPHDEVTPRVHVVGKQRQTVHLVQDSRSHPIYVVSGGDPAMPYLETSRGPTSNKKLLIVNNPTSLALSYFTVKVSRGRSQELAEVQVNDRTLNFAFSQQVVIDRLVIATPGRRRGPGGFVASVSFDSEYVFAGEGSLQVTDSPFEQSVLLAAPVRNRAIMGLQLRFSDATAQQLSGGGGAHLLSDSALNALMTTTDSTTPKRKGATAISKDNSTTGSRGFEVNDVILHGHFF